MVESSSFSTSSISSSISFTTCSVGSSSNNNSRLNSLSNTLKSIFEKSLIVSSKSFVFNCCVSPISRRDPVSLSLKNDSSTASSNRDGSTLPSKTVTLSYPLSDWNAVLLSSILSCKVFEE